MLVAHRPADPWLGGAANANESEFAGRLGPARRPGDRREHHARARPGAGRAHRRAAAWSTSSAAPTRWRVWRAPRPRACRCLATVSINHLSFNELDIGDYRTFYKLDPPLRGEDDRQALIEALASGLIDIVVSAHAPAPAEDKRLPFDEAAPGAVGLETLLPALLSLHHERRAPLVDLIAAVTLKPAQLLGLDAGALKIGAPADLVLCDIGAPVRIDADKLISKSKNSPFDGRSLQGKVHADPGRRPRGVRRQGLGASRDLTPPAVRKPAHHPGPPGDP